MLQQLRNPYWMKWGMWVILGLTIPSFVAFYGFSDMSRSGGGAQDMGALVTVRADGEDVELGRNELLRARRDAANYYTGIAYLAFGNNQRFDFRITREIYEALGNQPKVYAEYAVGDVALTERLDSLDIRVTDQQVAEYLRNEGVTRANFAERYGTRSEYEVAQEIREQLRVESSQRTVSGLARTSLAELWLEYILANEKLTVSFARIPIEADLSAPVAPEAVQAKYDELVKAESTIVREGEQRVYEYVSISAPPRVMPAVTDEAILEAYIAAPDTDPELRTEGGFIVDRIAVEPSASLTTDTARTMVAEAAGRIKAGESFNTVANEVILAAFAARAVEGAVAPETNGGRIPGLLTGKEFEQYGEEAMAFLAAVKDGDVSDVIDNGLPAIYRLEEKILPGKKPIDEVRDALRNRLRRQLTEANNAVRDAAIRENLSKLRAARREQTKLDGIARFVNTEVRTTSPTLSMSSFIPGIGNLSREQEAIGRMRPERVGEVMQTANGDVVVLRISQVIAPRDRPLDDIRTRVEQLTRTDIAAKGALAKAESLKALVTGNDDRVSSRGLEMELEVFTPEAFARTAVPEALQSAPDFQSAFLSVRKGNVLILRGGTEELPVEYFVVKVEAVDEPTKEEFLKEMQGLETNLLQAKRQGFLEDFRRDAVARLSPVYAKDFIPEEVPARSN